MLEAVVREVSKSNNLLNWQCVVDINVKTSRTVTAGHLYLQAVIVGHILQRHQRGATISKKQVDNGTDNDHGQSDVRIIHDIIR